MGDGRRLRMHWQRVSPAWEWYFYTYQAPIWQVTPGDWKTDALIDFTFQNKPQAIDRFRLVGFPQELQPSSALGRTPPGGEKGRPLIRVG